MNRKELLLLVLLFTAFPLKASEGEPAKWISLGSSARAVSLGGALSAAARGSEALHFNPALLAELPKKDLEFLQAYLHSRSLMNWAGYAHPLRKWGTIGLQGAQLKTSGAERRNNLNEVEGSFDHSELALGGGYGLCWPGTHRLALGATVNLLYRRLDHLSNQFLTLTLAAAYSPISRLKTALVLYNPYWTKQGDTEDKLPFRLRLGSAWSVGKGLSLMMDVESRKIASPDVLLGCEWNWKFLTLRAGNSLGSQFSAGFGISSRVIRLDFAFKSHPDLGISQVLSFGARFGKEKRSR